ncbi:malate:quinone oxidoreductase [Arthrobacter citreus]|uniref:malate:quinone oxidoreductase n=1 Tax=Arthrobacter TaxID=1663 RepID=UPI0012649617|nr:malate:quinone oxidoreductase [Arthrobacter gandavensis]
MQNHVESTASGIDADLVLIGGGIMSATLGSMITVLQPDWRIVLVEKADTLASESSNPWNNAGTGHSGFCELNYMPDPVDGRKAGSIARQFQVSRQWWAYLADAGLIDPASFIHTTPHMDVVFGQHDMDYLRSRYATMAADPFFEGLEFSDDPSTIRAWAPLVMNGRDSQEPIAATRHPNGTDIDFGALTRSLTGIISGCGGRTLLSHDVRGLRKESTGRWLVTGRKTTTGQSFEVRGRHVFVGAGGYALRLLQQAKLPEVRGYAVLPVGASFYRCEEAAVVAQHDAKVYGQAGLGAPPMSVPHLDKRVVDGRSYLMFGPYATFSTKLLKAGKLTDFFTTLRWRNLPVLAAAALQNLPLVKYLIKELAARPRSKFAQLQEFYPEAELDQWELIPAGQRAQLVTPDPRRIGVLQQGTELVTSADLSISGLLGASPGASTAVPIMLDLVRKCFPEQWSKSWGESIGRAIPGNTLIAWDSTTTRASSQRTAVSLGLLP